MQVLLLLLGTFPEMPRNGLQKPGYSGRKPVLPFTAYAFELQCEGIKRFALLARGSWPTGPEGVSFSSQGTGVRDDGNGGRMRSLPLSPFPKGRENSRKKALTEFWHSRRSKRYVLIQKILLPLEGELARRTEGVVCWLRL